MRNPRRAYNRDGTMVPPATVASHMANGLYRVEIFCNTCHHSASGIDVSDLPPDTAIPDICLRYRCSKCGGKNLMSRGDTREHYAQVDEDRRRRG